MFAIKRPKQTLATVAVLLAVLPSALRSQSCCQDSRLELLKAQLMTVEFKQRQKAYQAWKDLERRNVPVYNARLNGAVIAFHKHIMSDGHYLVTNCGLCRKHLAEIRSYSKKLVEAMK